MSGSRKSQMVAVVASILGAGFLLLGIFMTLLMEYESLYPVGMSGMGAMLIVSGTMLNVRAAERIKARGYC